MNGIGVVIALVVAMASTAWAAKSADEDLIPPEILKQMDADILSGKRPSIAIIKQSDIFGLREHPKFQTDFVTFGFEPDRLSTVQREVIEKWITSGANNIYLKDKGISKYADLFRPLVSGRGKAMKLTRHQVNTDCKDVAFGTHDYYPDFYCGFGPLPPGSSVIAETDAGFAICGMAPIGLSRLYLGRTATGADARRWELNYWHWALGLPVPGAAATGIPGSPPLSLSDMAKYDTVTLKNGDTVFGTILNEKFTIQTSYAELSFERAKIEQIVFEGAGANLDVIMLRVGDRMSGVLKDTKLQVKLVAGQISEIDRDKVKSIQMRKVEE